MKVYSPLDLQRMALTGVVIEPNTSAPAAPVDGLLWYDTAAHRLNWFNGSVWNTWYPITTRLDQILAPGASVSMNSQFLINLKDPVNPQDGATKAYVDAQSQGLDTKNSVRSRVITAPGSWNVNQWTSVPLTLDGVTPSVGDRFLVDLGTNSSGIFVWAAGDILNRAQDFDAWTEIPGAFTFVEQGTFDNNGYVCTNNPGGTMNTTPITFAQFSGAGSYTGGNGLTLTGSDFSVNVDGVGIEIVLDILRLKDGGVTSAKIADGTIVLGDLAASLQDGTAVLKQVRALGTGPTDAAPGNDPRFTDSRPPSGAAGGDLTGTYPNPTIAPGAVTIAKLSTSLVPTVDGGVATVGPAIRSLGLSAFKAMPGDTTLDQILPPGANVSLNSHKIVSLADGVAASDGVNKGQLDTKAAVGAPPTAHASTHQPGGSDPMAVDAVAATGSLRTLGSGAQQAAPGNHTHPGYGTVRQFAGPTTTALTPNTWVSCLNHGLGVTGLSVTITDAVSGEAALIDWRSGGPNILDMRAGLAVGAGAFYVVVQAA